jgi:hypothetical protein
MMTMNRARFSLLAIFLAFLVAQLISFLLMNQRLWPDELSTIVLKLLAIYAVYLGVILGGIFAHPQRILEQPSPATAWTAILVSVLWNLLLVWRSVLFCLANQDSVGELIKYLDTVASAGSFLVAGALGFFFAKGAQTNQSPRNEPPSSPRTLTSKSGEAAN